MIDDGSTDGTEKICQDYQDRDSRFRYIRQNNAGVAAARNTGLNLVTGDLISFIDPDDWMEKSFYERFVALFHLYKADIVSCGSWEVFGEDEPYNKTITSGIWVCDRKQAISLLAENRTVKSHLWNRVYRSEVWDGTRFEEGRVYEDVWVLHHIFDKAEKFVFTDEKLYFYRQHPASIVHAVTLKKQLDHCYALQCRYEYLSGKYPTVKEDIIRNWGYEITGLVDAMATSSWTWIVKYSKVIKKMVKHYIGIAGKERRDKKILLLERNVFIAAAFYKIRNYKKRNKCAKRGWKLNYLWIVNKILKKHYIERVYFINNKIGEWLLDIRETIILHDFKKRFHGILSTYEKEPIPKDTISQDAPVWVFWGQGENSMPPLVHACYESIKRNAGGHPVRLLSMENYRDYVEIPEYIIKKLSEGNISWTTFSDILRVSLLAKWGGIWLDATIYMTGSFSQKMYEKNFFTFGHPAEYGMVRMEPSRCEWRTFFMGSCKEHPIMRCLQDLFFEYEKEFDYLIDYFLIDYFLRLQKINIPNVASILNEIEQQPMIIYDIQNKLNCAFTQKEFDKIKKNSFFVTVQDPVKI